MHLGIFLLQLFDQGLTNVIEGQIEGNLEFILRDSDNIAYRMTDLSKENIQLILGGEFYIT